MGRSGADDSRPLVLHLEDSGTSGGRRLARVAAQWLREHLADNLSVGDLCRALNARERTLHHIRSADGTWLQASMDDLDVIRPRLA